MAEDQSDKRSWSCFGALCPPFGSKKPVTPTSHDETTSATQLDALAQDASLGQTARPTNASRPSQGGPRSSSVTVTPQECSTPALPPSVVSRINPITSIDRPNEKLVVQDQEVVDGTISVFQALWDSALAKLEDSGGKQEIIEIIKSFNEKTSVEAQEHGSRARNLAVSIKNEMEQEINSQRHDSGMTRFIGNLVSSLNKFVSVGDVAVSFDPVHAALPWAAVRAVLVIITAGSDLRNRIIAGIARVTSLFLNCDMYVRLYLAGDPGAFALPTDVSGKLETSIIETYTCSMQFLSYSVRQQQQKVKYFKAPFQLDKVAAYFTDLEEIGKQLTQAGDMCEKFCGSKDRSTTQEILRMANNAQQTIRDTSGITVNMYQEDLLSRLPTAGAAFDHIDSQAEATCHPETRIDLLQEIRDWINKSQCHRTFWLQGLAGTGKSTVSRTIAQQLDGNVLGASFFFKRGNCDRDNGRCFFTTIAYQLAHRLPSFRQHICNAISDDPKIVDSLLEVQFRNLIDSPLRRLEEQGFSDTLVFVVDALDECEDESHTKAIIGLLTASDLKCIKVFLTSRPEYDIRKFFSHAEGRYQDFVLHRIRQDIIEHDIRVVVQSRISEFRHKHNHLHHDEESRLPHDWPGEKRLSELIAMCMPLFISVATLFRYLERYNWSETPDSKVDFMLQYSATSEYGNLYYPILCRMLLGVPREAQTTVKDGFRSIVGPIVLLANPMSTESLARLLAVSRSVVISRLNPIHSVLDVPRNNNPIKLFHLSFRDFLVHEDARDFRIDEGQVHSTLSTRCLTILSECLKSDLCNVESPGKPRTEYSEELIAKCLRDESKYACRNWVYHMRASRSKIRDGDLVHNFLLKYFLNWLEALSLLDSIYEVTKLLDDLQALTDMTISSQVSKFLQDAKRFTMSFGSMIGSWPLQAYNSALVFAPMKSVVRQTFQSQFPNWLDSSRPPVVESYWSPLLQTLEDTDSLVNCIAFSSQGWLTSGSKRGAIKIWDPSSGACIRILNGHTDEILHIAVSEDGNLLASISCKEICIWDIEDGRTSKTWTVDLQHTTLISATLAKDASQLFLVERNGAVQTYDTQTGVLLQRFTKLQIPERPFVIIAISNFGNWLAAVSSDFSTIQLASLSLDSEAIIQKLYKSSEEHYVNSLAFNSDGSRLISLDFRNYLEIWDTMSGQRLYGLQSLATLSFSKGLPSYKDEIAMKAAKRYVVILDIKEPGSFRHIGIDDQYMRGGIAFSTDGTLLATCDPRSNSIRVWDSNSTAERTSRVDRSCIVDLELVSNSDLLVSASRDSVMIWNTATGSHEQTYAFFAWFHPIATTAKASLLAVSSKGGVEIWNLVSGSRVRKLSTGHPDIDALCFSENGTRLAASSSLGGSIGGSSVVEIWDTETGAQIDTHRFRFQIRHLILSPDGKQVVIEKPLWDSDEEGEDDEDIKVRNLSNGVSYGNFSRRPLIIFETDGNKIVVLRRDWSGLLLDVETGQRLKAWSGSENHVLEELAIPRRFRLPRRSWEVSSGYSMDETRRWIMKEDKKLLRLPLEYIPKSATGSQSMLAIGMEDGRVIIFQLA